MNADPSPTVKSEAPVWALKLRALSDYLSSDCLGGPRVLKLAWVVNFQKAGTFIFLGLLMWFYENTSTAAWVFLALHGAYGVIWLIKDLAFPDGNWQRRVTFMGAINSFLFVLGPYWLFGWLLISGRGAENYPLPDNAWYCLCISLCMIGCVVMIAADAQKHFTLKYKKGLITTGMHRYIRHPNYLGEMMIYGSLALMVWHWFPLLILLWVWLSVFAVNMTLKETSMSRYPEWVEYKKKSWWLVPFII
jgi:protein-S-isoprenylcysteine O-methyltransferase Ste14